RERLVDCRRRVTLEPRIARVADDADNGPPTLSERNESRRRRRPRDVLANRIAIAKELLGKRAVYYRDERRTQIVARDEHTTLDDWNPSRRKEVGIRGTPRTLRGGSS